MFQLCVLVRRALLRRARLQVAFKVLQQSDFLLQFFWELIELVLGEDVLLLGGGDSLALIVVEAGALVLRHDLGRVIEEDAGRVVTQEVPKTILGGVVDPLSHPDSARTRLRQLLLLLNLLRC